MVHNARNKKELVGKHTLIPSIGTHVRKQMTRAHTKPTTGSDKHAKRQVAQIHKQNNWY